MSEGLPVSRIVNVDTVLSPTAAGTRNFGSLLILGASDVIEPGEPLREYNSIDGVSGDFGVDDPEYQAAQLFFSQSPAPSTLYVARWAKSATSARLVGGALSDDEKQPSQFDDITNGSINLNIDGSEESLTGIDLSGATNLNAVAATIQSNFTGDASFVWNSNYGRFELTSGTNGESSQIDYATDSDSGTPLAEKLHLTRSTAPQPAQGQEAIDLDQAVQNVADQSTAWYGLTIAAEASDDDIVSVAGIIEAQSVSRIFGVTVTNSLAISLDSENDLGARLSKQGYSRTFWQYSGNNDYAVVSAFARAFTVDFTGQNTTITLKFKQEPSVSAETLNVQQARAIDNKSGNVYVKYNNDTAILQQGVMANGDYFDERHGLDWLQNYIQTNVYNLLYTSETKIPQTDSGVNKIQTNVERSCSQAANNGLLAAGVWNASLEFGSLKKGDTLPKGYYTYASPVANQSQADRAARKAPSIQVAAKLAGAIHSVDVMVNVNR